MKGIPKASVRLLDVSSKVAHEANKRAGRTVIEVIATPQRDDGSYGVGGVISGHARSATVTGHLPSALVDFFDAQKPKRGRPTTPIERQIARHLSTLYFSQTSGKKKARVRAANCIAHGVDDESAEKAYRRAKSDVLKSGVLKNFNRLISLLSGKLTFVMLAHKTATIEKQADGVRLLGVFWVTATTHKSAKLIQQDYFIAKPGANGRKTGGTIKPADFSSLPT